MTLRPGDVAQLRSGVIVNVRSVSERHAFCTWMDEHGGRHSDVFPIGELTLLHALEGLPEQPTNAFAEKRLREHLDDPDSR